MTLNVQSKRLVGAFTLSLFGPIKPSLEEGGNPENLGKNNNLVARSIFICKYIYICDGLKGRGHAGVVESSPMKEHQVRRW